TTSGPDGAFVFDELVRGSAFDLFADTHDGRRARRVDAHVGGDATTLTLKRTWKIEGVVVDARDGSPVAGATVQRMNARSDGREKLATTTDALGRFALQDCDGEYEEIIAAASDGRCSGTCSPEIENRAVPLRIEVGPAGAARG